MNNFEDFIIEKLVEKNSQFGNMQKIAFTEGWSKRMQKAAEKLVEKNLLIPILIFETNEQFQNSGLNDEFEYLIIENETNLTLELVNKYVEIRKGKEAQADVKMKMAKAPLFSAMLLETGKVAGAIGGVHNSTATILSNAFRAIGPAQGIKTISSIMMMHKGSEFYGFSDISVNPEPDKAKLVDIAINASNFLKSMGQKDKVAFLSFSTDGSAKTEDSIKVIDATTEFNERYQFHYQAIGDVQFDAAFDVDIRKSKYKKPNGFKKRATIYVFPDLYAGNIGYKIAQQMGNWGAIGPIITGLKKPFNDLSRGSKVNDVFNTAIITAIQGYKE